MGLPVSGAEMRGLSWGDYDGGGWFDLYAGATKATEANLLFRNESGRRFVRQALTPVAPGRSARQSSWVDFDNDGDLALFASHRTGPTQIGAASCGDRVTPTVKSPVVAGQLKKK